MDDPQMVHMTQMGVTSNQGLVGLSKALPDQPDEIALGRGLSAAISSNYLLGVLTLEVLATQIYVWSCIDIVRRIALRWRG
jgi:hypothetical protein